MGDKPRTHAPAFRPGSTGYVALQVALLVIGVLAFIWLINVVALHGDIFPSWAEVLNTNVWVAILLPIIGVVFLGEILLFFFQLRSPAR